MCGEAELWLRTAYPVLHEEYLQYPSVPSLVSPGPTCLICCLRPHSGLHYGLHTCEGDKQFLKRTFHERIVYSRCKEGTCEPRPRGWCQYCRLRRCLVSGVNLNLVRVGEARVRRGTKRTRDQPASVSINQNPPMYPQPQQMLYQPYQVFLKNETDRFWLRPPVNHLSFPPLSASPYPPSNPMSMSDLRFPHGIPFAPLPAPSSLMPHYRPWYVGPQRQTIVQKEPEHWYMEELANFMHFRKNEQNVVGSSKRPRVETVKTHSSSPPSQEEEAFTQPYVEFTQPYVEFTQSDESTALEESASFVESSPYLELTQPVPEILETREGYLCPKLELINEGEEPTNEQNYVSHGDDLIYRSELSHIQQFKIEHLLSHRQRGNDSILSQEELARPPRSSSMLSQEELARPPRSSSILSQEELTRPPRSSSILSQEELARPPRTSSEKSYKEDSMQLEIAQPIDLSSLSSPLDLSSVSSPMDLSSPSSRPPSFPRPASVEIFGPPRPLSTGSIGVSRPPSAGGSSRPPSLPGIYEMNGNNKFSVNSVVLQDALDKANISVANFANISNLSGVLEASI